MLRIRFLAAAGVFAAAALLTGLAASAHWARGEEPAAAPDKGKAKNDIRK